MIQSIKDRIPTNVLSNDAIRYGIYDEQGKLLRYEYIKREDEPSEEGTPINKALFSNLQGDLHTQDRYNKVNMTHEYQEVEYITDILLSEDFHQEDCIPKTWTLTNGTEDSSSLTEYTANSGEILSYYRTTKGTSSAPNMVDGDEETSANLLMYSSTNRLTINFDRLIKVTKFKIKIPYVNSSSGTVAFVGSLDGSSWTELYPDIPVKTTTTLTEFEVSSPEYYKHYGVKVDSGTGNYTATISELQITEYYDNPVYAIDKYIADLSLSLTSYETGKIVNIEGSEYIDGNNTINSFSNIYININDLGAKKINGIVHSGKQYRLVYNGQDWDIQPHKKLLFEKILDVDTTSITISGLSIGKTEKLLFEFRGTTSNGYSPGIQINPTEVEQVYYSYSTSNSNESAYIADPNSGGYASGEIVINPISGQALVKSSSPYVGDSDQWIFGISQLSSEIEEIHEITIISYYNNPSNTIYKIRAGTIIKIWEE